MLYSSCDPNHNYHIRLHHSAEGGHHPDNMPEEFLMRNFRRGLCHCDKVRDEVLTHPSGAPWTSFYELKERALLVARNLVAAKHASGSKQAGPNNKYNGGRKQKFDQGRPSSNQGTSRLGGVPFA